MPKSVMYFRNDIKVSEYFLLLTFYCITIKFLGFIFLSIFSDTIQTAKSSYLLAIALAQHFYKDYSNMNYCNKYTFERHVFIDTFQKKLYVTKIVSLSSRC